MRTLAEYSEGPDKVTLMHWNQKYIVRIERGRLEQVYKFDALDFIDAAQLRTRLGSAFHSACARAFVEMGQNLQTVIE